MIDSVKFNVVLAEYKSIFYKRWSTEKFKLEAVKCFQDNWDIHAENFAEMFAKATALTSSLLTSVHRYPKGMIQDFAKTDCEATRQMFVSLFDETTDLSARIKAFINSSDELKNKYGDGIWNSHFQNSSAVSTYLWLMFPDKYYIFKYRSYSAIAKYFGYSSFQGGKGKIESVITGFDMYDEIHQMIIQDDELVQMYQQVKDDKCYQDPSCKTLTFDFCFYLSMHYLDKEVPDNSVWWPSIDEYNPGITKEDWLALLNNPQIIGPVWGDVLAKFYTEPLGATCSDLAKKYNDDAYSIRSKCTQLGKRIYQETRCPLSADEDRTRYWPILFIGRAANANETGSWVWKLRPELYDALTEFGIEKYLIEKNPTSKNSEIDGYDKADFLNEVYMSENRYDSLVSLLKNKKNIILQGAPGVGKTFAAKRIAYSIMGEVNDDYIEFVQFHQNYSYEDFMMGYKPVGNGFELKYGLFYQFCQKAANQPDRDFFFIIDEINRGNMSKIFGELLMLIEKDYRGTPAKLAYDNMMFSVPKNLYIIGMMNTADRSLAMIDYALRRRFSFIDMEPGFDSDGFKEYQSSLNSNRLNKLIDEVKNLNIAIRNDASLGKGFCIGHSYLCGHTDTDNDTWIDEVVEFDLIPTLQEYWFDDEKTVENWINILRGAIK